VSCAPAGGFTVAESRLRRRLRSFDETLTAKPDAALVDYLHIPERFVSPARKIVTRVFYALAALFLAVFIVYLDRDGYRDVQDNPLSLLDCLYYATVSLSTTGYGDITPSPLRAADQRPGHHPFAGGVPDRVDRYDGGDPHRGIASGPQDPAMEELRAQPHRRHRLRHQR